MFNRTTLRTDIRQFFKELTANSFFQSPNQFVFYDKNTRPTKEECVMRNLIYAYADGRTQDEVDNCRNEVTQLVRFGILRPEVEIMGVTQDVFDNTFSKCQTYFSQNVMRWLWENVPDVLGKSAPFCYGNFGICSIRNFGGDKPTEIGKCGAIRYEMTIELKFTFISNYN
jgi:hypothetical protein